MFGLREIYVTLVGAGKWLADFSAGKTKLVSFDRVNQSGANAVKIDGPMLDDKSSCKILGLPFSFK